MVLFRGEQYFHNNPSVLTDKLYLSAARVISSRLLVDLGITCVINATLELPTMAYNTPDCLQIAVEDRVASKLYIYFDLVADKINSIHAQPNGRLLIYCRAGMSRSASLCIAYFIKYHRMTLDEAFAYVKERRPIIHPNIGFLRQLRDYEKKLQAIRSGVECPLSYQKRCDVPLPPLTYATQDSCDDLIRDYDVQTKVIKPKPKPRKPKINFTEVMELCAETYQTTSVQICSEHELHNSSCSTSTNVISLETSVKQMTEPTGAVATVRAPTTTFDTMDSEDLRSLFQHRRVPFTKLSEPGKIASLQNCGYFWRTLRQSLWNVSATMFPKI
ncbi:dual specificity protein phosphatase 16-like [Tigriopus californicus]|uniref:dual specificity protein phosphatase 16-like n=1 Tax=Tigriopus californicus TaxID=6832 RepID=UPI0027DA0446|nr:dual specificity protein phosphatase 16-like [Tigriopus californicus]